MPLVVVVDWLNNPSLSVIVSVQRRQRSTTRPAAGSFSFWSCQRRAASSSRNPPLAPQPVRCRCRPVGLGGCHRHQPRAMSPTPAPGAGDEEELSTTEVVVVRHGETAWNASRIVQGQMDPELNEAGRQQAVVVAHRLSRETKPAAIYSSDLKRAAETAEIIAKACGVSNVVLNEALRERHMGYLQGVKWDDAVAKSPDSFRGFDIFKIAEGSDPDSRNQELPVVLNEALRERHMGYLQGVKWDDAVAKSPDSFRGFDIFKIAEGSHPNSRNQELPGGGESMNQLNERCVSYLNKIAQQHIGERVVVVSHGAAILELCRHTDPPDSFIRRHVPNTSLNVFRISSVTGQWALERCGDVSHLKGNGFLENSFGGDGASA